MTEEDHTEWVDSNFPKFYLTFGQKGSGKSVVSEHIAEGLHNRGCTVLDLYAPDNLENLFYCVNMNHKKQNEIEKLNNPDNPKLDECNCSKRYPISILCSEYIEWNEKSLDWFNEIYYTKDQWVEKMREKGEVIICYDRQNPPKKSQSKRPKVPWIRIKKLPPPTKKHDTEVNYKIIKLFTDAVLEAREERRIVCFNPKLFPVEWQGFKTLEILLRSLANISFKHFNKLDEKTVGKPRSEWSDEQKNFDKMTVVMREFGEITSSLMKGDQSGESKLVKKSLLKLIRMSRHFSCNLVADAQREQDIFAGIKTQCDQVILKKSSKKLLGDSLEYLSDYVDESRKKILDKYGHNPDGFEIANERWPKVASLAKNQAYIVWPDDFMDLWEVSMPNFHHKRPDDSWSNITQVYCNIPDIIPSLSKNTGLGTESAKTDEKLLYALIYEKKYPKTGKPAKWEEVLKELVDLQEKGKVSWQKPFKDMPVNSLQVMYRRMVKKQRLENNQKTGTN